MDRPDDDRLVAYVYGELSEDEARRVEDALAANPNLRAKVDALRSTQRLFAALEEPEPPPRARSRVLAHARAAAEQLRTPAEPGWFSWLRKRVLSPGAGRVTAAVVAGLAALVAVPAVLMRPGNPSVVFNDPQPESAVRVVGAPRARGRPAAMDDGWAVRGGGPVSPAREAKTGLGVPAMERKGAARAPVERPSRKDPGRRTAGGLDDRASPALPVARMASPRLRAGEGAAVVPSSSTESLSVGVFGDEPAARSFDPSAGTAPARGYAGVLATRLLRLAESKIVRGERDAARGIFRHAVAQTEGSAEQGEVWLRWAQLEFEDNRLELAETYAGRALEVKGFQGQDRVRALLSRLSERREGRTRPPTD